MKEETIKDIEKLNLVLLSAGSLAVLLLTREFKNFVSYSLACAIMALNFRLLKLIIEKGFSPNRVSKKLLILGISAKFLGLLAAVSLLLLSKEIDFIYFFLGLSSFFLSVLLSQVSPRVGSLKGGERDGA